MRENKKEYIVITVCPLCGQVDEVAVNEADYWDWKDGTTLVQDAFPYLTAEERERLITGICPDCWYTLFSGDEEEEDSDYWEDDVDECGFNPYMGCYDYDC